MKAKYVEERFPRYFEFGTSSESLVDVSSTLIDPVVTVTKDQAKTLIEDRDVTIDMLGRLAQALDDVAPELLNYIWYKEENNGTEI